MTVLSSWIQSYLKVFIFTYISLSWVPRSDFLPSGGGQQRAWEVCMW